jgi:hypothetical protein
MDGATCDRLVSAQVTQVLAHVLHERAILIRRHFNDAAACWVLVRIRHVVSVHLLERVELWAGVQAVCTSVAKASHSELVILTGSQIHELKTHENGMIDLLRQSDDTCLSCSMRAGSQSTNGVL